MSLSSNIMGGGGAERTVSSARMGDTHPVSSWSKAQTHPVSSGRITNGIPLEIQIQLKSQILNLKFIKISTFENQIQFDCALGHASL